MRAILKGFLLALFVCVLPVACGPEEPGSGGEPGPKVRLLRAETQRIQSPDVTEEQVAERLGAGFLDEVRGGLREHYVRLTMSRFDFEKGTEAAAATVLAMTVSSVPEPVNMSADRPFIFAIAERETGEILFLGRVTDPKRRGPW